LREHWATSTAKIPKSKPSVSYSKRFTAGHHYEDYEEILDGKALANNGYQKEQRQPPPPPQQQQQKKKENEKKTKKNGEGHKGQ